MEDQSGDGGGKVSRMGDLLALDFWEKAFLLAMEKGPESLVSLRLYGSIADAALDQWRARWQEIREPEAVDDTDGTE